jgi:excisionase family DNA binding protein
MTDALELDRLEPTNRGALLTVHEAAASLRLSERTVWRCIRDGRLEAVRLGGPGSPVRIRARSVRDLQQPYTAVG